MSSLASAARGTVVLFKVLSSFSPVSITTCNVVRKTGPWFAWSGAARSGARWAKIDEATRKIKKGKGQKVYTLSNLILRAGLSCLVSEMTGERVSGLGRVGGRSWVIVPAEARPALLCPAWGPVVASSWRLSGRGLVSPSRLLLASPLK